MKVSFEGIGDLLVTFAVSGTVTAFAPVKVTAAGRVSACAQGDPIDGIAVDVSSDGCASVLIHGYAEAAYSGDAPECGRGWLCADGDDGVCVDENEAGPGVLITDVDTAAKTVGFFL